MNLGSDFKKAQVVTDSSQIRKVIPEFSVGNILVLFIYLIKL